MTGIEIIKAERERQVNEEGFTHDHDYGHRSEHLARAAVCYALPEKYRNFQANPFTVNIVRILWPWALTWWKPTPDDRVRELAKAGALIAAEIDRLRGDQA